MDQKTPNEETPSPGSLQEQIIRERVFGEEVFTTRVLRQEITTRQTFDEEISQKVDQEQASCVKNIPLPQKNIAPGNSLLFHYKRTNRAKSTEPSEQIQAPKKIEVCAEAQISESKDKCLQRIEEKLEMPVIVKTNARVKGGRRETKQTKITIKGSTDCNAPIVYVNAGRTPNPQDPCSWIEDGKSWATAFTDLQKALVVAQLQEVQIWVAQGTYIPSVIYSPSGVPGGACGLVTSNLNTFNIPTNTKLYGGFKGNEKKLCQRNPSKYVTILSGANTFWHVVTIGNDIQQTGVNAYLSGFTITAGNAAGPNGNSTIVAPFQYTHSNGGGIYAIFGSFVVVDNCVITKNNASTGNSVGAGIFAINCNIQIGNCNFNNNFSGEDAGALALYSTYQQDLATGQNTANYSIVRDSTFSNNVSVLFGGAIVVEGTIPAEESNCLIKNCYFTENSSDEGGAIVIDSITTTLECCNFYKNFSYVNGGALTTTNFVNGIATTLHPQYEFVRYTTTVEDSQFDCNYTFGSQVVHDTMLGGPAVSGADFPIGGGAIVSYIGGVLVLNKSYLTRNNAYNSNGGALLNGGGAGVNTLGAVGLILYSASSSVTTECVFSDNTAVSGGAIASQPNSFVFTPPIIIDPTQITVTALDTQFSNNTAQQYGGAIYFKESTLSLVNVEFTANKALVAGDDVYAV